MQHVATSISSGADSHEYGRNPSHPYSHFTGAHRHTRATYHRAYRNRHAHRNCYRYIGEIYTDSDSRAHNICAAHSHAHRDVHSDTRATGANCDARAADACATYAYTKSDEANQLERG